MELGGQCSVTCAKTGYSAEVNFLTKPFYGGKKDQIRAKAFGPESEKPFFTVEGEWNGQMIGRWTENGVRFPFYLPLSHPPSKTLTDFVVADFL